MVKQGTRPISGKIIKTYPHKISEITESKYEKFIIKFGASYCPPCKLLSKLLEDESNWTEFKEDIPIFLIEMDGDQNEIAETLTKSFEFSGIPYSVVTNKSLKVLGEYEGYGEKKEFIKFIKSHFN